jgi:glutamine synthetase
VQDDPSTLGRDELARRGITRLPTSLAEATGLFEGSDLARRVLGDVLHGVFAAVRRRECETHGALGEEELADAYRWRY